MVILRHSWKIQMVLWHFFLTFKRKEGNIEGKDSPERFYHLPQGFSTQSLCNLHVLFYPDDLHGIEEMQPFKLYPRICILTDHPGDSEAH